MNRLDPSCIASWHVPVYLDHGALDDFIHPNTGDVLRDHRDSALWLGHSHRLNRAALGA